MTAKHRSKDNIDKGFYSLGMLKTELNVSRRSLERAIKAGLITPCAYTLARRPRFSRKQVEELKCRAREHRSRGSKYVMGHITSIGTTPPPKTRKIRVVAPSASAWVRKKVLKHNPDMLRSYRVVQKYLDLDAMLDL